MMMTPCWRAVVFSAIVLSALGATSGCEVDPYRIETLDGSGTKPHADRGPVDSTGTPEGMSDLGDDSCAAEIEVCNNADDNCDGQVDEGFDKLNDPTYCESCKGCAWLAALNAVPRCDNGKCAIAYCDPPYCDYNGKVADGCESPFGPCNCIVTGPEICDGIDNDCNWIVDDGLVIPPNFCKQLGACAGATPKCMGGWGWVCQYGPEVELWPCTKNTDCGTAWLCNSGVCSGIVIVTEQKCDGYDGDCDGVADDGNLCGSGNTCTGKTGCQCNGGPPCTGSDHCCGGGCINLSVSTSACGACGVSCGANETCDNGCCRCGITLGTPGGGPACKTSCDGTACTP